MPSFIVNCPQCGRLHTLEQADLGRNLSCAACGSAFKYSEPLKAAKEKEREKARKRRAIEAEEKKRRAAEDQRKAEAKPTLADRVSHAASRAAKGYSDESAVAKKRRTAARERSDYLVRRAAGRTAASTKASVSRWRAVRLWLWSHSLAGSAQRRRWVDSPWLSACRPSSSGSSSPSPSTPSATSASTPGGRRTSWTASTRPWRAGDRISRASAAESPLDGLRHPQEPCGGPWDPVRDEEYEPCDIANQYL